MWRTFLGFQIDEQISQHNRSVIYRGRRVEDGAPVILKVMAQAYPRPSQIAWFRREKDILDRLSAPEIVRPLAAGFEQHRWGLVLEDIGGESLDKLLQSRRLSVPEVLVIGIQISGALAHAHAHDVIHKDVNPGNIVIHAVSHRVQLIDFGIATVLSRESPPLRNPEVLEGTLAYLSPEQTGRMNRAVDYRTDLYSLGVTLYVMITGQLPFPFTDPMELVHAHIALPPRPPSDLRPEVKGALSDIVLKLMAKNAEDRYSSADSLRADLEECEKRWKAGGQIGTFELDTHRAVATFELPQKLYGREPEARRLAAAFERATHGSVEMLVVSGYSGIGKSALVQEIYRPLTQSRGYFAQGKFDQLQREVPYASIVQAFRSLLRLWLTESPARVAMWKAELSSALGASARVLADVIPEMSALLGDLPPVAELGPAEALIRFHRVLDAFISVVARADHPLVLFLDDLQWVDAASLSLLKQILTAKDLGHLLVIGAYRDNEVTQAHPLLLTMDEVRKAGAKVTDIVLAPLDLDNLRHLVADTLGVLPQEATSLAELLLAKTQGNPFFARELLRSLFASGQLRPDKGPDNRPRFSWDLRQIRGVQITDNVVDLLASKIAHLPEATRHALMIAGALGNQVDLKSLALSHGRSLKDTASDLWPALSAGFLVPLDDAYQVAALDVEGLEESLSVRYRFAHDRIQQAAYSSIPPGDRARVHWDIGKKLEARLTPGEQEERLFELLQHLNAGSEQAESIADKEHLAALNLRAARRAKGSAAFKAVHEHAKMGMSLLGDHAFERNYDLALALADEAAESAYVITDYEQMDLWIDLVLARAKRDLDTQRAHETRIVAMNARLRPVDAIATARSFLRRVGVTLPDEPTMADVQAELGATQSALARTRARDLERLKDMISPKVAAAVRVMTKIYSSAYIANPLLFIVIVLTQVRLVAKHGNTAASPLVYGVYGLLLAGLADDVRGAYEFGTLADRLKERADSAPYRAQATHLFNCHTRFWAEPLMECSRGEGRAYRIGLETGELEYGCYGAHVSSKYAYMAGAELSALRESMAKYTEAMHGHGQHIAWTSHASWEQAVINLTSWAEKPWELKGTAFDDEEMFPKLLANNDRMAISNAWLNKLILCTMFGRWDDAVAAAEAGAPYLGSVLSQMDVPLHTFHEAFARLSRCRSDASPAARRAALKATSAAEKKLKKWSRRASHNFAHKRVLLTAERARLAGEGERARDLYDEAAKLAQEAGFLSEEALIYEAAARFYLDRDMAGVARHYAGDAYYAYLRWGATAKVKHLKTIYPQLASHLSATSDTAVTVRNTATTTRQSGSSVLDMATVLKASQTIAGQVVLADLLRRLMHIVMENAGAQRGMLLLEHAGDLRVEAEGEIGRDEVVVLGNRPLEEAHVSAAIIRYSARTKELLVLDDATADPRFSADPHVIHKRPRSVLSMPIVNQGNLIGVLYLENVDAAGAFTPERVELLHLLSGQIAVSIDNARLYETLERKVAERTEQLEVRNRFIRETFGRYLSDEIVASLLETPAGLSLGGEKRKVTILMTDLRGFTALTDTLPPEKVVAMLNSYLSVMTDIILSHQGTIDELIGDAILAIFGAPLWRPDHAEKAVACALRMQLAMDEVNRRNREAGLPELEMGVGLNTGEVVVGNIGSEKRAKYGVVGLAVNLAARIESYTVGGQVLVAESTKAGIVAPLRIDSTLVVQPKGMKQPITIVEVGGMGEPYHLSLPQRSEVMVALGLPLEVRFTVLRGKDSIGEVLTGFIERLGTAKAELRTRADVPPLSDLRIAEAAAGEGWVPLDVYGKVAAEKAEKGARLSLTWTSVPGEARAFFQAAMNKT